MGTIQSDRKLENSVDRFRRQFEDFEDITETARYESEIDRDYKDNKQWTEEEVRKLTARNQAPIVVNRIKPKIEGMKGLLIRRRTDPRAFPRTQKHEKAAEAITDALRYVNDNTDFDDVELRVADNVFVEGYGGVIVGTRNNGQEWEVTVDHIPWDRIYYDPHSRAHDFSDARYMGIVVWLDADVAQEMFPDADIDSMLSDMASTTFDDKPLWVDSKRKRVKVCQHFYIEGGTWKMVIFSSDIIVESQDSPYFDEGGEPTNPIELVGCHIDRDLRRFGEVRYWRDLQDEINHRRSKFLFYNSARQTMSRKGAIKDTNELKRELAKPNGHVEYEGEKGDFDILPTGDMASAQFDLLQHSEAQLDSVSFNAQLAGERQGDLSGRAVDLLQQAGSLELSPIYSEIANWKRRCYRQIWSRIKQYWNEEKWIRVTDNYNNLRWIGLNYPMTLGEMLQEKIQDEAESPQIRQQAAQALELMMAMQDPRLGQVREVRNEVAKLDVDIILESAPDSVNVQREQFEMLANIAASRPEIPFKALLSLSELRGKDDIMNEIDQSMQANAQAQQQAMQNQQQALEVDAADKAASIEQKQAKALESQLNAEKTDAEIGKILEETKQKEIENLLLVTSTTSPQVII